MQEKISPVQNGYQYPPPQSADFGLTQFYWQFTFQTRLAGRTVLLNRTLAANRVTWQAQNRAQLHHGLVMLGRILDLEHCLRGLGQSRAGGGLTNITGFAGPPRQYTEHIPIRDREGQPECNAGDGRRSIGTHSGKSEQPIV